MSRGNAVTSNRLSPSLVRVLYGIPQAGEVALGEVLYSTGLPLAETLAGLSQLQRFDFACEREQLLLGGRAFMGPYPVELRRRVVAAYLAGDGPLADIAERFMVSVGFVHAMVTLFERTGAVEPQAHRGGRSILGATGDAALRALVDEQPDATLAELRARLWEHHRLSLTPSGTHRALV